VLSLHIVEQQKAGLLPPVQPSHFNFSDGAIALAPDPGKLLLLFRSLLFGDLIPKGGREDHTSESARALENALERAEIAERCASHARVGDAMEIDDSGQRDAPEVGG